MFTITELENLKLFTSSEIKDIEINIQPTEFDKLDFDHVNYLNSDEPNATEYETESKKFFINKRFFFEYKVKTVLVYA